LVADDDDSPFDDDNFDLCALDRLFAWVFMLHDSDLALGLSHAGARSRTLTTSEV
jgi:hypothetical protein